MATEFARATLIALSDTTKGLKRPNSGDQSLGLTNSGEPNGHVMLSVSKLCQKDTGTLSTAHLACSHGGHVTRNAPCSTSGAHRRRSSESTYRSRIVAIGLGLI